MPKSILDLTGLVLLFLVVLYRAETLAASATTAEAKKGYRLPAQNGWTYVHLEGTPHEMGFQNGYLLSSEVADMLKVVQLEAKHDYQRDWSFFRDAAQNMMWPRIEQEYREEL